uniref:F-box domain-containing protein n=1 Tax=Setaria italica TaxID=4555 RepID=K3ZX52_SETIT
MDCSKRSAGAVASLPDDPLVEILSRVPVKSLCRFKCVSKAWRDLIADPLHRKKLPQTLEGFFFLGDSEWSSTGKLTYLIFDTAASSHFHLVQIEDEDMIPVHVYSSKSGVWSPVRCDLDDLDLYLVPGLRRACANGMLYVVMSGGMHQIAVMDVEGNIRKIIPVPLRVGDEFWPFSDYVGQSQGHLHYIYHLT